VIAGLISTEALFPHAWERWFGLSGTWALLIGGIFLIFNLVLYPDGVAGAMHNKKQLRKAGLAKPSIGQLIWTRLVRSRHQEATDAGEP
jgi:branched-chain amino acid transport system permease protein